MYSRSGNRIATTGPGTDKSLKRKRNTSHRNYEYLLIDYLVCFVLDELGVDLQRPHLERCPVYFW